MSPHSAEIMIREYASEDCGQVIKLWNLVFDNPTGHNEPMARSLEN